MSSFKPLLLLSCLVLGLLLPAYSNTTEKKPFKHYSPDLELNFIDVEEQPLPGQEDRNLATTSYSNIRIAADYSNFPSTDATFTTYIQQQLMPAVMSFFQGALRVKQPLTSPITVPSYWSTICGLPTPAYLQTTGKDNTDLLLIVTSDNQPTQSWVAQAGACSLASGTNRPIIALVSFNLAYTKASADLSAHEGNIYTTLHELTHALGFSSSMFPNFIDANGNKLTNHTGTATIGGKTYNYINVEPLTTNLRNHYGCSTIDGAYLENDGGSGTAGSHFEKRFFVYEYMTGMVMNGPRVSKFALNLLEGSGWYAPDYSFAEPFTFGQGDGCTFFTGTCANNIQKFTNDYCNNKGSVGCSVTGRTGAVCGSNGMDDGCIFENPQDYMDCENPANLKTSKLPNIEAYGKLAGSRCFAGSFRTYQSVSSNSYSYSYGSAAFCLKMSCSGSGLSTVLTISAGNKTYNCTKAGTQLTVTDDKSACAASAGKSALPAGFGAITCPDPIAYCGMQATTFCPRNCMGRGQCNNGVCTCNTGFSGTDCSWSGVYTGAI